MPVCFAGFLRGEELAAAYASCDVFVMPSRTETLGLVVLEAMSSGLPVVGARAGGIPELIQDGTGCLFDSDGEAIDAVRSYLNCPKKREATGIAARAFAADHSWRAATVTLIEHYKTACAMQNVSPVGMPAPVHPGFRFRARKLARRTTIYAIRKLLP
jgi:glycosyltransferase involved in cell wall biosynthesis